MDSLFGPWLYERTSHSAGLTRRPPRLDADRFLTLFELERSLQSLHAIGSLVFRNGVRPADSPWQLDEEEGFREVSTQPRGER